MQRLTAEERSLFRAALPIAAGLLLHPPEPGGPHHRRHQPADGGAAGAKTAAGRFFYRLCSDMIAIPSLAQRIQEEPRELDDLLDHTVTRILGNPSAELTGMLAAALREQVGLHYAWPGNVRELEQSVRRILLNRAYDPQPAPARLEADQRLAQEMIEGRLDAQALLTGYCYSLYRRMGTYEAVARHVGLDRRTVKKYIEEGQRAFEPGGRPT